MKRLRWLLALPLYLVSGAGLLLFAVFLGLGAAVAGENEDLFGQPPKARP
jgi:hypothetical protein